MLRFETAGESHGECLVATLTGLPAQVPVSVAAVNRELWRRQQGYGRGGRMKIETDTARIVSGVRHSQTTGAPVAIIIENKDWSNWTDVLPVESAPDSEEKKKRLLRPRPGHADLPGCIKYNYHDARYILERASARETTSRVAAGALCKQFLARFGIGILSHVIQVGTVRLGRPAQWEELELLARKEDVLLGCVDAEVEQRMKEVVDEAYRTGDTVGGVFEVVARNVPPGLGSHITWDSRLDGRLAQAIVSMQAVKGVEIGFAAEGSASFGSKVQDTIHYDSAERRFTRGANRAGHHHWRADRHSRRDETHPHHGATRAHGGSGHGRGGGHRVSTLGCVRRARRGGGGGGDGGVDSGRRADRALWRRPAGSSPGGGAP